MPVTLSVVGGMRPTRAAAAAAAADVESDRRDAGCGAMHASCAQMRPLNYSFELDDLVPVASWI